MFKRNHKVTFTILGVLILILIGAGLYIIYAYFQPTTLEKTRSVLSMITQPTPAPTPLNLEQANTFKWKSFSSQQYQFSLTYPEGIAHSENQQNQIIAIEHKQKSNCTVTTANGCGFYLRIYQPFPNPSDLTLQSWANNFQHIYSSIGTAKADQAIVKETSFANQEAIGWNYHAESSTYKPTKFLIKTSQGIVYIESTIYGEANNLLSTYQKIIDSIQFN